MELIEIAPDVYACLQPDEGLGYSNSGFVRRGGGLVIDTFWDLPRTRALIDHYAAVAPAAPGRLVNTHHNGDHCWGNQLFAEMGTEIIGHRRCVERMPTEASPESFVALCEHDDAELGSLAGFVRGLRRFDFRDIELTPATTVIDDDATIELDGAVVELLSVGPAHTAGDVAVFLPETGVLFTGDVLFEQCTPIGWEGSFANWIAALDRLEALQPAVVVPGHGPVTDASGLRGMREYLAYVREQARAGFEAGLSTLETAKGIDLGPYRVWKEPERLAFQVDRAYRELRGEPWDAAIDVGRVFAEVAALRAHLGADGPRG